MVSAVASRGSDSWSPWSAPLARADGAERDPSQPIAPESGIVSADADRHDPDGVKH